MVGTWNSTWPVGTISVKANKPTGQQNTTYIEANMKLDHYWNEDINKDGHHKKVEMPKQTADIAFVAPIDGGIYLKQVSIVAGEDDQIQVYYKNIGGTVYQATPTYKSGVTAGNITSSYSTLIAVPKNVYGEIFMWATAEGTLSESRYRTQTGYFRSNDTYVNAWAVPFNTQSSSEASYINVLRFGSGSASSNLDIRVKKDVTNSVVPEITWNYRITYRAI